MSLTLDDIRFLQSEMGQAYLQDYAMADVSDKQTLRLITTLRKTLTLEQASAVLTTVRLRQKAIEKFPEFAGQMLFTDASLQQASDALIRQYRTTQVADAERIFDVCCSIGSDALAFAQAGFQVQGFDNDAVRIEIARHNADVLGVDAAFDVRDVVEAPVDEKVDFVFYDPARRTDDGNRIFDVEQYLPPLSLIETFCADEVAVKLSPAVDLSQLEAYGGQVEFISVNGDLKEAVLWVRRADAHPLATLIRDEGVYHLRYADEVTVAVDKPREWLFEPDPSVLRAGLVQHLAHELNATQLDDTIAYVTMDDRIDTVWGRYWRILDWMPFHLKKLKRYLVEWGVGQVTVKKRGFPMSPEDVIQKLKLKSGDVSRVLVMTRYAGNPIVLICDEV